MSTTIDTLTSEKILLSSANTKSIKTKKSKEVKEALEKIPQLEKENFRIDSTDRKEILDKNWVKLKVNPQGDVWEILEWENKGEQLFTFRGGVRETMERNKEGAYDWTQYEEILKKKYKWDLQKFIEWENIKFCWEMRRTWKSSEEGPAYIIWVELSMGREMKWLCWNASSFNMDQTPSYRPNFNHQYLDNGYSIRCFEKLD